MIRSQLHKEVLEIMILCSRRIHYVLLNSATVTAVELLSGPSLLEYILWEKLVAREI